MKTKPAGIKYLLNDALRPGGVAYSYASLPVALFSQKLSELEPGLGSVWTDYCSYLQEKQPRPDLN
jgi:hypothetical protein